MILLDANLLIYAYIREMRQHRTAREWLDRQLSEANAVGFPWESITAFLRIVINRVSWSGLCRSAPRGDSPGVARQRARLGAAGHERQAALFGELLTTPGLRANDIPDAYLAALAIDHGLILCSADSGFARFARLRWRNPLAE